MSDGMAIWADWPQVTNGIDYILSATAGDAFQVMHVNESFCQITINPPERESADIA
jgi:hypothetical protein